MSNGPPETPPPASVQLLDERLRMIATIIGIMVIVAGSLAALWLMLPLLRMVASTLMPFAVGLVFAYIFDPIVTFVQRRLRLSRIGGVIFLYVLFIAALSLFFALVLPILIEQSRNAYHGVAEFVSRQTQRLGEYLGVGEEGEQRGMLAALWEQLALWLAARGIIVEDLFADAARSEEVRTAARTAAVSGFHVVGDALTFFFSLVLRLFGSVAFLMFAILANIYLLIDFSKLRDVMEVLIPARHQKRSFDVLGKVDTAVGGFIRGMLIDAFIVGVLTFLGLTLLGLHKYALLIAIVAGVGNLIPYLGPILGATPALLYVGFSDAYDTTQERLLFGLGVLVLFGIVQAIDGLVLQPRIVGRAAQLHPLAVLIALAAGANFGLTGMILAVPIACIVRVLLKEFYWDQREIEWKDRTGKRHLGDWLRGRKRKQTATG